MAINNINFVKTALEVVMARNSDLAHLKGIQWQMQNGSRFTAEELRAKCDEFASNYHEADFHFRTGEHHGNLMREIAEHKMIAARREMSNFFDMGANPIID